MDTVSVDGCPVGETLGYPSLESCGFTWLFDVGRNRFRRVPRGVAPELAGAPDEWVPYRRVELQVDRSCFVVTFDAGATRVVRSWLHVDPCAHCHPVVPGETILSAAVENLRLDTRPAVAGVQDEAGLDDEPVSRPRPYGGRRRPECGERP